MCKLHNWWHAFQLFGLGEGQRAPASPILETLLKFKKNDRNRIRKWETILMNLSPHMIMIDHDTMIQYDLTWLTVYKKNKAPTCFLHSLSLINWNLLICANDRDKVPRMHKQALTSCSVRTMEHRTLPKHPRHLPKSRKLNTNYYQTVDVIAYQNPKATALWYVYRLLNCIELWYIYIYTLL